MKKLNLEIIANIHGGKVKRDKWAEFRQGACFGFGIATATLGFFSMSHMLSKSLSGAGIAGTLTCAFV